MSQILKTNATICGITPNYYISDLLVVNFTDVSM